VPTAPQVTSTLQQGDEEGAHVPQKWSEWNPTQQEWMVNFWFRLLPAFHVGWAALVKKALANKTRISKQDIDAELKISDYGFLMTVLFHYHATWRNEYEINPLLRLRGTKGGANFDTQKDAYLDFCTDTDEKWKPNPLWESWFLAAQCEFLDLDVDGSDAPVAPKPQKAAKRKVKLFGDR
jgi:hypothetical protein